MKIFSDQQLKPKIEQVLTQIEDRFLFHQNYGLKHPLALFNTSFNKIEESLQDFFRIYEGITFEQLRQTQGGDIPVREIIKSYRSYLYSLREYLDDCYHIAKSFVAPDAKHKDDRNQYNWLLKNAEIPAVQNFLNATDNYKRFLDEIVNALKHNNAILNGIIFFDEAAKEFCLGYYVANVVNERYEPVQSIHADYQGEHTAFSFGRDVRFNMYHVFAVAEELLNMINNLGIEVTMPTKSLPINEKRESLFRNIMDLPRTFFPDEYQKPVPSVSITDDKLLKLEYPSMLSLKPLPRPHSVMLYHSPDGKTRSFALLYYSDNKSTKI